MAKIICLANSRKLSGRCIAGIRDSFWEGWRWVRPVSSIEEGQIEVEKTKVSGRYIQPLDIVEIPIGNRFFSTPGYEDENQPILSGSWMFQGKASASDVIRFCESSVHHSQYENYIPFHYLKSLPRNKRKTLQLIRVKNLRVERNSRNSQKWYGFISVGGVSFRASITDISTCEKLNKGYSISSDCLVVVSLGQPWVQPETNDEPRCYRLIASVIEL